MPPDAAGYRPLMPEATDTNAAFWKSDEHIAQWVASADERERHRRDQRRLLAELLPLDQQAAFTFIDLGAGTGAAARVVLDAYPNATAVLADFSPQMMDEGAKALAPYAGRYRYVELDLAHGTWPEAMPAQVPAVISSLCVHHLPDDRKRSLFAEILDRLTPGGWYLNYDVVAAGDPVVGEAWERAGDRRDPAAAEARHHRTPEQQRRYENHVRYMIPLAPQLQFLAEVGFEGVDVYWKQLDAVIYGGRRPLLGATR